jgi:hypothetical protein
VTEYVTGSRDAVASSIDATDNLCAVGITPRFTVAVRRRTRLYPEWVQALFELRFCPGTLDLDTLESLAEVAHERTRSPMRSPSPALMALRNGFVVLEWPGMPVLAQCLRGTIYHRREACRARLGFALYHELAEAILERSGLRHNHTDVQILTLLLIAPRSAVVAAVRRMGAQPGTTWLCRVNRYAPAWAVRWRVALVWAAAEAA